MYISNNPLHFTYKTCSFLERFVYFYLYFVFKDVKCVKIRPACRRFTD